ncbi:MAG: hypothetical protein JF606_24350 [Burkholderiales bacterium]|jgi:hypothetical protein|nr:hypothetical protein [Burkholderiales bacterium]
MPAFSASRTLIRGGWEKNSQPLRLAEHELQAEEVEFAFYGGLFRGAEIVRSASDPGASSDEDGFDEELWTQIWRSAAEDKPGQVFSPDDTVRGTPAAIQAALNALSRLPYFAGLAMSAARGDLTQLRRYMREPTIRQKAQDSVNAVITPQTRVLVAHSLGSVVSYEALHRFATTPNWSNVNTLVTLGSPLGIRNLIFDALDPAPHNGRGRWPVLLQRWTNISDDGDVVALEKKLSTRFGERVVDIGIDNGVTSHHLSPYLSAAATGRAIASGL